MLKDFYHVWVCGNLGNVTGPFEQTFIPKSYEVSILNLSSIGPVVSEEMFENVDGRLTPESLVYYYTTLSNFSTKYLVMCKVYTDVGGIK